MLDPSNLRARATDLGAPVATPRLRPVGARWPWLVGFAAALARASRRRWLYAAVAAAVIATGIVAWGSVHAAHLTPAVAASSPACATLPPELDAVWSPAARRALLAGNPAATTSAAWLADVIDYYAIAWPERRRAACVTRVTRVTRVDDRAWSPAVLDGAATCLASRRAELTRAIAVHDLGAGELVAEAATLHDPRQCGDPARLPQLGAWPAGDDGTARAAVTAAIAAAQQLAAQHQLPAAIDAIERVLPQLRNEPDPRYLTDYTGALALEAALEAAAGQRAEALATARSGLVVQERIYGTDHPALLPLLHTLGRVEHALGRLDDARATLGRAHQIALVHLPAGAADRVQAELDDDIAPGR